MYRASIIVAYADRNKKKSDGLNYKQERGIGIMKRFWLSFIGACWLFKIIWSNRKNKIVDIRKYL